MNGIDTFLDINNAHLRVNNGNVQASTFVLDQIDFIASSNASTTVGFNNATTAFLAASNIEVGTANLFVDTTTSNVGIGTNAPLDTLHINGGTLIGGHILPTQHEQFDIGSADAKIRHLFLSDNSLWLGDETRISFTEGKMKFRRRKKNILPRGLVTIGATAGHANETATRDAALAHAGKSDITDMKLENWLGYAKTLDATKDISDVFTQDENEYEASAASEAFTELGTTTIASSQHVAIATSAPPQYPLDVEGDINFSGNLRKNGELFGWTSESSNLFYVNGNVGVGTSLPQGTMHISSGGTGDCKLILEADTDNNGAGSGSGGSNTYTVNFTTGTAIPSTSKVGGWHTYTYGDFVLPTDFTKSNLSISVTWNGTMPIRFALGQYVGFHLNKLDSNGNEHSPAINANFVFNDPGQGISGSGGGPTIYNGAIRTSSSINNGRWVGGDTIRASMGIFRHYFSAGHTCSIAITYDRTSSSDENDNPMILFRQDGGIYESSVRMSDNRLEFVNSASTSNGFAFYLGNQESSTGTSGLDAAEEKVTIDSAGNLGIGQTTPTQKLDVAGTVKATAFEGDGSALTGISGGGQWTESSGDIYRSSGNVGVGTDSPAKTLHVAGTMRIANATTNTETTDIVKIAAANTTTTTTAPNTSWSQEQKLLAYQYSSYDYFGQQSAVSGDGNTICVGARNEDTTAGDSGAVYVYTGGPSWTYRARLKASDAQASDVLGEAGLSISDDGRTIVVAARLEDTGGTSAGAAYVFMSSNSTWGSFTQQKLQASNKAADDQFCRCDVSGDGNTIIVGAPHEDGPTNSVLSSGAAYIYSRSGNSWSEDQILYPSDPVVNNYFGVDNALNEDGTVAAIAATGDDTTATDSGAVYIFTKSNGTWSQEIKLKVTSGGPNASDGWGGVCLSDDGLTLSVGTSGDDTTASNSGAVYVFNKSGGTWSQTIKLKASNAGANDKLGGRTRISGNGNTIVSGAREEDTGSGNAGSAYIFTLNNGTWSQRQQIQASDRASSDYFGDSVGISKDGTVICVGAVLEDGGGGDSGAAYAFRGSGGGTTTTTTTVTPKLKINDTIVATAFEGDGSALTGISGGGQWTESSGDIYRSSGNVGIGQTTPTQKLDVAGTVKATAFEGDGSALTGISSGAASFGGTTRPLWRASYTSTNGNRNTGTVPFNRAEINQRSGYSTSTGLFTAPVAGHYWVYGQMYSHAGTGKNEICFIINGSASINRLGMAYGVSGDTIPHFVNMPLMTTVWLNVNDTIGVYVRDAYAHYNGVGVAYFGGHLLA